MSVDTKDTPFRPAAPHCPSCPKVLYCHQDYIEAKCVKCGRKLYYLETEIRGLWRPCAKTPWCGVTTNISVALYGGPICTMCSQNLPKPSNQEIRNIIRHARQP